MDLNLKGKAVIVTAASKGLGRATARAFAAEGARVMISSRNEAELANTAVWIRQETGSEVLYRVCDMASLEDIQSMVKETATRFGGVDVLVNNAGGPPAGGFDQVDDEAWQKSFEINLLSFIRTIREVLPYMRKQKSGHIVNIASSSIKQPIDQLILSNTFRTGLAGLAKSLSQELAPDNILINTVGPGRIATDRIIELDRAKAASSGTPFEQIREESEQAIPLGRYGTPEEFAKVVVFLCSAANTYTTGQAILIDGGLVKAL